MNLATYTEAGTLYLSYLKVVIGWLLHGSTMAALMVQGMVLTSPTYGRPMVSMANILWCDGP